jgi:hypothetical protein
MAEGGSFLFGEENLICPLCNESLQDISKEMVLLDCCTTPKHRLCCANLAIPMCPYTAKIFSSSLLWEKPISSGGEVKDQSQIQFSVFMTGYIYF